MAQLGVHVRIAACALSHVASGRTGGVIFCGPTQVPREQVTLTMVDTRCERCGSGGKGLLALKHVDVVLLHCAFSHVHVKDVALRDRSGAIRAVESAGGILNGDRCAIYVSHTSFYNVSVNYKGGAIRAEMPRAMVASHCEFRDTRADAGGAIYVYNMPQQARHRI